ncbi:MAG: hypothetical protein AB8B80_15630 [Marinicellaceae bacterium]
MNSISTQNLTSMPSINDLKMLLKSLAALDAIVSPEWESRYYSFNSQWGEDEQMGSMRNGCGDEFFVLFNSHGCFIKGFAHESAMSSWSTDGQKPWKGLLKGLPIEFKEAAEEPAFSMDNISFCLWRSFQDTEWKIGKFEFEDDDDPDGSEYLLELLDLKPSTYQEFANDYYELELELPMIENIYNHRPITKEHAKVLNPEVDFELLSKDLIEIGYPIDPEK